MGVTMGVFPLFLEPLEASFDATRTQISLGPILVMFALAGAGVVAGGVLDKGRVRKAMLFGAGMMTTGLLIASLAPNLAVMAVAADNDGSWFAWSWGAIPNAGACAGYLDMTTDGTVQTLTEFGALVALEDPNGISRTATAFKTDRATSCPL